jgi:hypothetical protein
MSLALTQRIAHELFAGQIQLHWVRDNWSKGCSKMRRAGGQKLFRDEIRSQKSAEFQQFLRHWICLADLLERERPGGGYRSWIVVVEGPTGLK